MRTLPTVSANDEYIGPVGWPVGPLSRITPLKRRGPGQQAPLRQPVPQDSHKPKPG